MELTVHGKQINVGESLKAHVQGKLEDVSQKYFNHTTFATVTFSKEGHGHPRTKAHISIQLGKNILIVADATEPDPYVAFDSAAEKAAKQLRRYKRKLRDHHERLEQTPEAEILKARKYILAATPEAASEQDDTPRSEETSVPVGDDPVVIAEMSKDVETMSVSEAVMRLDLSGENAIVFRNASNQIVNVVFRRADGNIGWIDPENHSQ